METEATLRYLRMSPRKVRLVADLIRGEAVETAMAQLQASPRGATAPMLKLLRSAVANAQNRFQLEPASLVVKEVLVDGGPTLKRVRPRAFGRAAAILKRTCHIRIILAKKEDSVQKISSLKKTAKSMKNNTVSPDRQAKKQQSGVTETKVEKKSTMIKKK